MSAFNNPEVIRMLQEDFIPVALDNHVMIRKKNAEGDFYRSFARSQARYVVTADGRQIGGKTWARSPFLNSWMKKALKSFAALERKPVQIADNGVEPTNTPPPDGALILKVTSRLLKNPAVASTNKRSRTLPAYDRVWLTKAEWQSLLPPAGKKRYAFDPALLKKFARYHMIDIIGCERPPWPASSVGECTLEGEVLPSAPGTIVVRLSGSFKIGGPPRRSGSGERGVRYKATMDLTTGGVLEYDKASDAVTRFDLVAYGPYMKGDRPAEIGFHFQLAGAEADDGVPPWHVARYVIHGGELLATPYFTRK